MPLTSEQLRQIEDQRRSMATSDDLSWRSVDEGYREPSLEYTTGPLPGEVESSEFFDPADIATFFTGAPLAAAGVKSASKGLMSAIKSYLGRKVAGAPFDPSKRALLKLGAGAGAAATVGGVPGVAKIVEIPPVAKAAIPNVGSLFNILHTEGRIGAVVDTLSKSGYKVLSLTPTSGRGWGTSLVMDLEGAGGKVARAMVTGGSIDEGALLGLRSILDPKSGPVTQSSSDIYKSMISMLKKEFKDRGWKTELIDEYMERVSPSVSDLIWKSIQSASEPIGGAMGVVQSNYPTPSEAIALPMGSLAD